MFWSCPLLQNFWNPARNIIFKSTDVRLVYNLVAFNSHLCQKRGINAFLFIGNRWTPAWISVWLSKVNKIKTMEDIMASTTERKNLTRCGFISDFMCTLIYWALMSGLWQFSHHFSPNAHHFASFFLPSFFFSLSNKSITAVYPKFHRWVFSLAQFWVPLLLKVLLWFENRLCEPGVFQCVE